jgi:hypothetical protein
MNTSNPHQLTQQSTAEPTVEFRPKRAERPIRGAQKRRKPYLGSWLIRAATHEAKPLYQLERAGESDWTPWIAIGALILFSTAIGLLMFGIVEAASRLLGEHVF